MINVKSYSRRKLYSDEEKQNLVNEFIKSGLPRVKFCMMKDISSSAMYRWNKEFNIQKPVNKQNSNFIPITTKSNDKSKTNKLLHIKVNGKIEISIPVGFDISYVTEVIKRIVA